MKPIIKLGFALFAFILLNACNGNGFNSNVVANSKTSFKVWGNCEMCKETIEGSLKVDGIKEAEWNKDTKIISVHFDSTKINLDQIQRKVASVGYDNEKYKGDDNAYASLPECCQYSRK